MVSKSVGLKLRESNVLFPLNAKLEVQLKVDAIFLPSYVGDDVDVEENLYIFEVSVLISTIATLISDDSWSNSIFKGENENFSFALFQILGRVVFI